MNVTLPPAPARSNARQDLDSLLDLLADRIAERVAARIAPDPSTRWARARDNPLGSARAFLDAGRRGDFETFKRGREVVARWGDVEGYISARKCERMPLPGRVAGIPANANAKSTASTDPHARRRAQLVAVGALPPSETEAKGPLRARTGRK